MSTEANVTLQRGSRRRLVAPIVKAACIAGAMALYVFPPRAEWIERHYSRGLYPSLQTTITPLSNWLPLPVSDLLILALVLGLPVWWAVRLRSAGKGRRWRALGTLVFNTATLASVFLLVFQFLWGLNYGREPLSRKLDYDQSRITLQAVKDLAASSTAGLNAESAAAHASAWPDDPEWARRLLPPFDSVVKELGNPRHLAAARAKHSIFDLYLKSAGIDGFTDPFGLDVILSRDLLAIEQPFALAHEWAHLAGFADESEANFIALLTCLRSEDPAVRYAGWLDLYPRLPHFRPQHVSPSGSDAPQQGTRSASDTPQSGTRSGSDGVSQQSTPSSIDGAEPQLAPEVESDLRAIAQRRSRHISPWLSTAQWRVYDRFLKANRVQTGVASYGLFVRLLLGTRFETGWTPVLIDRQ